MPSILHAVLNCIHIKKSLYIYAITSFNGLILRLRNYSLNHINVK